MSFWEGLAYSTCLSRVLKIILRTSGHPCCLQLCCRKAIFFRQPDLHNECVANLRFSELWVHTWLVYNSSSFWEGLAYSTCVSRVLKIILRTSGHPCCLQLCCRKANFFALLFRHSLGGLDRVKVGGFGVRVQEIFTRITNQEKKIMWQIYTQCIKVLFYYGIKKGKVLIIILKTIGDPRSSQSRNK